MPSYCAFLGHQPAISIAELSAVFPDMTIERRVGDVLLFSTQSTIMRENLRFLGGTFLLGRKITNAAMDTEDVPQILANELTQVKGKATFALRAVGVPRPRVRELYRDCKDALKRKGIPSRYVGNERKPAASALLRDAGLLDPTQGCEILLLKAEDTLWIGRTIAAQNPDAYGKRDMDKPVRDTRAGLLPPKLAQILLNFGEWLVSSRTLTVYDPFCGTGVIPMECVLRGFPALGSDISQKAAAGCQKNLEWVYKEYGIKKKDVPSRVWKQDALKPFALEEKEKPQVIVTETVLGPALTDRALSKDATKMRKENEDLQAEFLRNVAATLPGVPVVATWPVWYLKAGPLKLEKIWEELGNIGFEPVLPPGIAPDPSGRVSLLYRRPDQFVGREIVMLRPKA